MVSTIFFISRPRQHSPLPVSSVNIARVAVTCCDPLKAVDRSRPSPTRDLSVTHVRSRQFVRTDSFTLPITVSKTAINYHNLKGKAIKVVRTVCLNLLKCEQCLIVSTVTKWAVAAGGEWPPLPVHAGAGGASAVIRPASIAARKACKSRSVWSA